eukprot:TRINITY_DN2545_c1_g1_i1.p1 TRINITY_DN2545_c1_g1~~TRINITY_DN2545_c1_g1_i1.p1  ORF type:complete len:138 (+),score=35.03 TRINITY_DN2545_c1_g1_i1:18-431(+)
MISMELGFDKFEFLIELQELKDEFEEISHFGEEKLKEALVKKDLSTLRDQKNRTFLNKALMKKEKEYEIEKIKFLIEYKCGVEDVDDNYETPLSFLFEKKSEYIMKFLKEIDFDVNKYIITEIRFYILHVKTNQALK